MEQIKIFVHKDAGNKFFISQDIPNAEKEYLAAVDLLNVIDVSTLSEQDQHLYIDLKIKIFSNLAACANKNDQHDLCIQHCNTVLEIDPIHEKCLYRRSKSFEALDRLEEAMKDLLILIVVSKENPVYKTYYKDLDVKIRILKKHGCVHYPRYCEKFAPCCSKYFPCRFCHNEQSDHEIDRYKVTKIRCNLCETEQLVSNKCIQCGVEFAKYFCGVCNFFDDTPDKSIYHCAECGLCRIGPKENFYHCNNCACCMNISTKDNHKCLEKRSQQNCPVCLDDLHTSRSSSESKKLNRQVATPSCAKKYHCWSKYKS